MGHKMSLNWLKVIDETIKKKLTYKLQFKYSLQFKFFIKFDALKKKYLKNRLSRYIFGHTKYLNFNFRIVSQKYVLDHHQRAVRSSFKSLTGVPIASFCILIVTQLSLNTDTILKDKENYYGTDNNTFDNMYCSGSLPSFVESVSGVRWR